MAAEDEAPEIGEEEDQPDIFYVAEEKLKSLKAQIAEGKEVTKDDLDQLTFAENLADDAMVVPVDMRGVGEEFEDVEQMVEKLGPKGAAEAFMKARDYFEANKTEGDDCAKPMTAKEWNEVLQEDNAEFDDFQEVEYGECAEEEFLEEPEEEEGEGDDDGEAEEPAAKKAKTD